MPRRRIPAAVWLFLVLIALFLLAQAAPLYTDWLWFQEVGYVQVFLSILTLRAWLFIGVGFGVFIFLYLNLSLAARAAPPDALWELEDQLGLPGPEVLEPLIKRLLVPILGVIAFFSGVGAASAWETVLAYFNGGPFGDVDPIFKRDLGFYVFSLPFWRLIYGWGLTLLGATFVLSLALYVLQRALVLTAQGPRLAGRARSHLLLLGAAFLVLRGVGFWLDRFELLYSPRGAVVFGASYTDVNASLPVLTWVLTVVIFLCAVICLIQIVRPNVRVLLGAIAVLAVVWIVGLGLYPAAMERFRVAPNQLEYERPYLTYAIRMTRQAYDLNRIEAKPFSAEENLDAEALRRNELTVKNIRLWDHRPLLPTYDSVQGLRPYYKFLNVDNDRYLIDGELQQMMLSPRELSYEQLRSRLIRGEPFVNEHLIYTHGYGVVVSPVNRISPEGLPEFLVEKIPPVATGFVDVTQPGIYFGESSNRYVFVRTNAKELDYGSAGDKNVYTRYHGQGGIPIGSFLTKLAFAVRFGEIKILLSNDLVEESRIMIYRTIGERVRRIAPFLRFDEDPYLVITEDGRLVWIIDAYTETIRYPYSEPVAEGNYIRNSVKATVDAYDGSVTLYLVYRADPLVQMYHRAFPGLFKALDEMPPDLRRHIRYPADLFAIQAKMYATYHMEDPQVFYGKEDLWVLPRRAVEGGGREMEPYYTILRLPGEEKEEFVLLMLYNPSGRHNMIAWLAARSDGANYGRLIAFMFPKGKTVYGPQQIDAFIDQKPEISQQLSLWNQRGSETIRGSLLAIPIEESLIYVQPLYLAASAEGALPELIRVFVAYGDQIEMEPSLEQSLERIFGGDQARPPVVTEAVAPRVADQTETGLRGLAQQAWEAWSRAQGALRKGDWSRYGSEQRRLEEVLQELRRSTPR